MLPAGFWHGAARAEIPINTLRIQKSLPKISAGSPLPSPSTVLWDENPSTAVSGYFQSRICGFELQSRAVSVFLSCSHVRVRAPGMWLHACPPALPQVKINEALIPGEGSEGKQRVCTGTSMNVSQPCKWRSSPAPGKAWEPWSSCPAVL